MKMSSKRIFDTECIDLDDFGKGLCRVDGKTVFVDNLLPKEKAEIETIYVNGKLKKTNLIKRLSNSKDRVKPFCKYFHQCGGCSIEHLKYEKQLEYKKNKVKNLLHKFANIDIEVCDTLGLNPPLYFRNKVQVPVANKNGKMIAGYYKEGSHDLIRIENCPIESKMANDIVQKTLEVLNKYHVPAYDTDRFTGVVRHVLVKVSEVYNQALVVLVTATDRINGINSIVNDLKSSDSRIVSICQNINTCKTNVILGQKTRVLYGTGKIKDGLCGCDFLISTRSFFQTNLKMTEVLYNKALELAKISKDDIVLDAYCGTGSIGIIAAKYAKEVVGVEVEKSAVLDAINNAKINDVENISFINMDCTEFIERRVNKNAYDIVVMDPPRAGSTKRFIDAVQKIEPKRIIYISCDPVTLARDLKEFNKYRIDVVQPVDMFPHSFHIETIVALSLKIISN